MSSGEQKRKPRSNILSQNPEVLVLDSAFDILIFPHRNNCACQLETIAQQVPLCSTHSPQKRCIAFHSTPHSYIADDGTQLSFEEEKRSAAATKFCFHDSTSIGVIYNRFRWNWFLSVMSTWVTMAIALYDRSAGPSKPVSSGNCVTPTVPVKRRCSLWSREIM